METQITSTCNHVFSEVFKEETEYCKNYYLTHQSLDWTKPRLAKEYDDFFEGAPFDKDEGWMKMTMDTFNDDNYMGDSVLDAYSTEVYAMIPPNYFPALWHYHTYFELVYVLQGTAINYMDNASYELHAGDFMILGLGSRHAISSYNDDCILVNIMVKNSTFWNIFSNNLYESDILYGFFTNVLTHYVEETFILFHTADDSFIKSLVINLLEERKYYHKYADLERRSAVSMLFARIMDKYASTAELINNDPNEKNYDITMILSYMQQHYTQISLPQLAEFFGYSERQTRRLLLKFTGKGYQENLDFIRMKEAERLLNNSDKSIEEIGSTVGFSSVYSFRKNFKNYYGITPSEYRNQKITSTF